MGLLKEFKNINGILLLNSVLSHTLKAVALTQPGAVRPDSDNVLQASQPVCVSSS